MAKGDVPESLKGKDLVSLDLGMLIAGTKFCCNNCNKSVPIAKIGSIDENKKVIFCSTECFNDYEFNTK